MNRRATYIDPHGYISLASKLRGIALWLLVAALFTGSAFALGYLTALILTTFL